MDIKYDRLGRRLVKQNANEKMEYLFDNLDPVSEFNTKNSQHRNYYRGIDKSIIKTDVFTDEGMANSYWYSYDALNSIVGITNNEGKSHHNYVYEDFGSIIPRNGNFLAPHNSFTYTGQEFDESMNLYEFAYRVYDSETGTWLQKDPYEGRIYEPMTLHKYSYAHLDPINNYDPDGRAVQIAVGGYGVYVAGGTLIVGVVYLGHETGLLDQSIQSPDLMTPNELLSWLGLSGTNHAMQDIEAYNLFGKNIEVGGITYKVYNDLIEGQYGCYGSREMFLAAEGKVAEHVLNKAKAQEDSNKENQEQETIPRPEEKHPKDKLPTSGEQPYSPKKQKGSPEVVNNPESTGGYLDEAGNVWEWNARQGHWDVQHPNGTHTNVNPNGSVTHGPNNF